MLGFKSEHKAIYFAEKAEDAMDKLWDECLWDDENLHFSNKTFGGMGKML